MVWTSTWPLGTSSVSANKAPGQGNTTYIENTVGTDHFWNESATKDGHHRYVQTEASNIADPTVITNSSLAADMNLVYFSRFMTSGESVAQQDVQPFVRNDTDIMQLLGIRACALIQVIPPGGTFATKYAYNCSVTRQSSGKFYLDFTSALPSEFYLVSGGAVFGSATASNGGYVVPKPTSNSSGSDVKGSARFFFWTVTTGDTVIDPVQAWVMVYGG